MKRAVSILLLLILTVTAIQPTLAFHFCGGSLHSVGIGQAGLTCCRDAMESEPAGETALAETATPCCSGYTIEIATDTCRLQPAATTPAPHPQEALAACFPASVADNCLLPALPLPAAFPPGAPAPYTSDHLALICVWRK